MTENIDEKALIYAQLRGLLALVLVAALLGGGAYWYFQSEERAARVAQLEQVDRIEIHVPEKAALGQADIILLRDDDDQWFVEQPFRAKASSSRIESITTLASRSFEISYELDRVDLKKLGLDTPAVRLTLNDVEFALGGTEPISDLRYVLVNDKVVLLDGAKYELLEADVYGFLENRLSQYTSDIVAVQIGRFRLEQNTDDAQWSWSLIEDATAIASNEGQDPDSLSTDNEQIERWLDSIKYAYALRAADGRQQRAKFDSDLPRLRLEMIDGHTVEYELISTEEETIFHDPASGVNHHFSTESQSAVLELPAAEAEEASTSEDGSDTATDDEVGKTPAE